MAFVKVNGGRREGSCYLRKLSVVSAGPAHSFTHKTGMKPSHTMPLCVFFNLRNILTILWGHGC